VNLGTSNAETDSLDFAVRLLAVGVSANCARTASQSTARAALHPGTSAPLAASPERHSGLDATKCGFPGRTFHALPAPVGSAQPIAHCGVLPVDPMTTARTVAPNHGGRANTRGRAVVASCIYGCTKLQASIADGGSIPQVHQRAHQGSSLKLRKLDSPAKSRLVAIAMTPQEDEDIDPGKPAKPTYLCAED